MAPSAKIWFPLVALGLAVGCGDSANGADAGPGPTDVGGGNTDVPGHLGTPRTYDYVINSLTLNMPSEPGTTTQSFYGFNLDGRTSPSSTAAQQADDCSHGDFFSTVDPDQNTGTCTAGAAAGGTGCRGGVDNQLPDIAGTIQQLMSSLDVQQVLNEQISAGRFLILVRISDVDGDLGASLNDPSVHVNVYPYAYGTVADCATIQTANQTYTVDDRSLSTPGDLTAAKLQFAGSIVNGRLRVTPPTDATTPNFSLPLSISGVTLSLDLYQTQLRVTPGASEGVDGNLGGYLRQSDLIMALTTIPALHDFEAAAGPLIQGFVDIATGSPLSCTGLSTDASSQGGIGVGLGFTTRRATISTTTVGAAPAGVCGAPTTGADGGTATDAGH